MNTQLLVLYARNLKTNRYIDNQKVQVVDEITRDIWNYLVRYDEADLALHEFPANLMWTVTGY